MSGLGRTMSNPEEQEILQQVKIEAEIEEEKHIWPRSGLVKGSSREFVCRNFTRISYNILISYNIISDN
jgi:hypothetical protein